MPAASLTVSFDKGVGGFANYSKNKGEVRENGTTWNESTVTATDTLTIKSGEDTNIIGSQVKGDTVKIQAGGDLNIESLQDTENYSEDNKGVSVGVNVSYGGKAGVSGGISKQEIDSDYKSVQEQAGVYAGKGGFDIEVGNNTDLKGAVIASEADAENNKLSTGTLTYSDIENKAEWEADTIGVNLNTSFSNGKQAGDEQNQGQQTTTESKDKGATPNLAGSDGKAESVTKSAIAEGEIEIRDNSEQDISDLSRDTDNANNPLDKIFDRDKILERQEAAAVFGEIGFSIVGDIAVKMGWNEGSAEKIALHALIGGIMAEINGGKFGEGMTVAAINELVVAELAKMKDKNGKPFISGDIMRQISAALGMAIGGNQGANIADSATAYNYLSHWQKNQLRLAIEEGDQEKIDYWLAIDKAQDTIIGQMGLDSIALLDDPSQEALRDAIYQSAQKIYNDVPLYAVDPSKLSGREKEILKNLKDEFNDNVTYVSYGTVGITVAIPGIGSVIAGEALKIGGVITLGTDIYYEVRYSDADGLDKVTYVGKEIMLAALAGQVAVGKRYVNSWDTEQGRKFLSSLGKSMSEVRFVGTMLDIIADAMINSVKDKSLD